MRRSDYYEKTPVGWMLHSQMVKIRRSIGQYGRWNKRRILERWMKECQKRRIKVHETEPKEPLTLCEKVAFYRYIKHLSVPEIAEKLNTTQLKVVLCIRKLGSMKVES